MLPSRASRLRFLSRLFLFLGPALSAAPWRPGRTALPPAPPGPPGSSHPVGGGSLCRESHAGDRRSLRSPGANGQYRCVSVRPGSVSPSAVPGIRLFRCRGFRSGGGLGQGRDSPSSREYAFGSRLRTKSLPPDVVTPLNCRFLEPSRVAGLVRWEEWRRVFLWRREVSPDTCVNLQSLKRHSVCRPWEDGFPG